jgi:beta-glucuronidase
VHGRGVDLAFEVKNFNLLHWVGANSFRTSHYPYDESIVRLAERYGIVIIDEVPGVAIRYTNDRMTVTQKIISNQMISSLEALFVQNWRISY